MSKSRELHPVINFGLVPLLQLILAFLVVGLLIVLIGENPVQAVQRRGGPPDPGPRPPHGRAGAPSSHPRCPWRRPRRR